MATVGTQTQETKPSNNGFVHFVRMARKKIGVASGSREETSNPTTSGLTENDGLVTNSLTKKGERKKEGSKSGKKEN